MAWAGMNAAPASQYNVPIGPHRRFTWVRVSLADVKAIKDGLGGTVNDVMLAIVAGALGRDLRRRGVDVRGLELKAMVPVSVRAQEARGALGNQVAAMMAPLPVGAEDPVTRFETINTAMRRLKEGGQAVGAKVMTDLSGFAPPNIMSQAARVVARQRFFNVVVTNVPGPQFPLYLMGREMIEAFPMVPLLDRQALGVAIMSYNGHINFGLVGDYDVMADIDQLAKDFRASLLELAEAGGVQLTVSDEARSRGRNGHRPQRQVGAPEAVPAPDGP
jgi:WS/DGAT/MGAT family acyltransferase